MAKVLRILSIGITSHKKVFPTAVYNTLITAIKEAIILSNYKSFIDEQGFISPTVMSKAERFGLAYIDRQTIIRTFRKYNINYNTSKQ